MTRLEMSSSLRTLRSSVESYLRNRFNCFRPVSFKGRIFHHAVEIVFLCKEEGIAIRDFVRMSFSLYDPEFCESTFRTPWPPLAVVMGDAARNRVKLQASGSSVGNGLSGPSVGEVDRLFESMRRTMTCQEARKLVSGGWPQNPKVREELAKRISGASASWNA